MNGNPDPPSVVYRVEWWRGHGWPRCTERTRRRATYDDEAGAQRAVARILARPTHDVLIGVWVGTADWERVELPRAFGNLARMINDARDHMAAMPVPGLDPIPYTHEGSNDDGED